MSKPMIHAMSSAKKHGGNAEDYFEVHQLMDSSKGTVADNRHRALTHNTWFIMEILERVKFSNSCEPTTDNRFPTIINSNGKHVSVRDIGEQHILEDFGNRFIPTPQDYIGEMEMKMWMNNGAQGTSPPSHKKIAGRIKTTRIMHD